MQNNFFNNLSSFLKPISVIWSKGKIEKINEIKKLRLELGMTQQEFADEIGFKRNTVALWERGRGGKLSDRATFAVKRLKIQNKAKKDYS
jgi:DNA-binding XRE family transcriptional regulator